MYGSFDTALLASSNLCPHAQKINAKNTWSFDFIEHMDSMIESDSG